MRILKVIASACASLAIMAAIFYLSSQTSGESGSLSESIARLLASTLVGGFDDMSAADQQAIVASMGLPVRKAAHGTEYAVLGISLVMTCWQVKALLTERKGRGTFLAKDAAVPSLVAFALSVLYAASDEFHQLFVDGRAGQITDVCIDACGAAIGCALAALGLLIFIRARRS